MWGDTIVGIAYSARAQVEGGDRRGVGCLGPADDNGADVARSERAKDPGETSVALRDRVGPREPAHVGALPDARLGLDVVGDQEVPQVEVGVPARPRMNVDVDECGGRGTAERRDGQTGLLPCLSDRGAPRGFPRVDVSPRLQPQPEPLVLVEHHASDTDDDRRRRHVRRVGVLAEGFVEPGELEQETLDRGPLPFIHRPAVSHLGRDLRSVGCAHASGR